MSSVQLTESSATLYSILGERLKIHRLNMNITQQELAELSGVSRKVIIAAEKGKVQLENLVAIMVALNLKDNIMGLIPALPLSPILIAKAQHKTRQRATANKASTQQGKPSW